MNQLYQFPNDEAAASVTDKNIAENSKFANTLLKSEWFKGQNFLLIGAGPSLDLHWDDIKKLDNYIICCASRALICCQEHGVMPQLVFHIDGYANYYFDNIKISYLTEPMLCISHYANYELILKWKGARSMFHINHDGGSDNDPNKFTEGNHVGATMADFALLSKAKDIQYFGYDYCFRGAKVVDKLWGEAVVCFQNYAAPWNGCWVGYKNNDILTNKMHPFISDKFEVTCHTYPYEIAPGLFTTDNMRINKMYLKLIINKHNGKFPNIGEWE